MKADANDRFYNVGTGKRTSLKELAEKLLALTGSNQPIKYAPRSQATLVRNRIGSPDARDRGDRLRGADIALDEGLQRLIAWRSAHKEEVLQRRAGPQLISTATTNDCHGQQAGATVQIALPSTGDEEWQAVREPLMSGWLTQGPKVAAFERAFAERHKVDHALATTSCTTALHLALAAIGIGPGDEVIVPAFTWIATANVVLYCGATPVFSDVDPHTFNIDSRTRSRPS